MHPFVGSVVVVMALAALVTGVRAGLRLLGEARGSVAAATTLAVLAGATPTLARATGIVGAVVCFGVVGGVAALLLSRRATPVAPSPEPWSAAARRTSGVLFVLLVVVALTTFLWDEASTHLPLAGAAARDLWPLEQPFFPGQALRYHPGFAVVGGIVRAFTALPLDLCLDIVSIAGFVVLLWIVHDLARALGLTSSQATLALVVVLLAGSPVATFLADGWGAAMPAGPWPSSWVNGATFPPLVVTNLFQHPQGLGLPLACAALLLVTVDERQPLTTTQRRARLVAAALLVLLCGRVQIVIAAYTGLALVVIAARRRDGFGLVVLAVVAVAAAFDSGFVKSGDASFAAGGYFAGDGLAGIVHAVLAFGISAAAPVCGAWLWRTKQVALTTTQRDLLLALVVTGTVGFVVGNVVHYTRSWDIVKFFGVSAFFGHFVVTAWLVALWPRRRVVVVVVTALSCWSGAFWLVRHGVGNGVVALPYREQGTGDDVAAFADAYGSAIGAHDRVYAPGLNLARAGFLTPGTDWRNSRDTQALLLDRGVVERMTLLAKTARDFNADALAALDVRFVVVRNTQVRPELLNRAHFTRLAVPARGDAGFSVFAFSAAAAPAEAQP